MSYAVKEMFLTVQGEGIQAGRRAVFIRFAGCNLWSGREEDRAKAECTFCDTDFVGIDGDGGGRFADAAALAAQARSMWAHGIAGDQGQPFTVLTGGEPMLQVDAPLVAALKAEGFEIAIETNGTLPTAAGIDWICVSPKAGTRVVQQSGNELKMVWPQPGLDVPALEGWAFDHWLVQPMDGPDAIAARDACIAFVMQHPRWRLSTQTHKLIGVR
ncbi:7-carboxy-7-deazaguanine synthase [Sphingomonas sp. MMS24-J13]|uniref:7-carboxy-7-deazaguanine synthase n=1 Tax=Sphingomonas sp. MMS24-J13 TaxID=3238686 RepID=UPI00384C6852